MVRKLDTTSFTEVTKTYKTSNPELRPILKTGVALCKGLDKQPVIPDRRDLDDFWASWDIPNDKKLFEEVIKKKPELLTYYNFLQLKWANDFYGGMEELDLTRETTSLAEMVVYFSLLYPFPETIWVSVPYFIECALPLSRNEYRKKVAIHMIEKDPEALAKLADGMTIPWYYTKHMSYFMLRRLVGEEVIRRNPEQFKILLKEAII